MLYKQAKRLKRHKSIRKKIKGIDKKPRLSVFRSNKYIYLQLINDANGKVLVAVSDKDIKQKENIKKVDAAFKAGEIIAEKALDKKFKQVVFDRGGYKYHGRVKAAADGARKGGLVF